MIVGRLWDDFRTGCMVVVLPPDIPQYSQGAERMSSKYKNQHPAWGSFLGRFETLVSVTGTGGCPKWSTAGRNRLALEKTW